HRGKFALRRVLTTDLRAEAASYGFVPLGDDGWQQTRICCPGCGASALLGRMIPGTDCFTLRCPACYERGHPDLANWQEHRLFQGLSSHRVALSRLSKSAHIFYRCVLSEGAAT
ncbi:MAG TPA: hypothetical protein VGP82_23085, partial [Ktedonobacterales bacterium]|nr:hypothetical protein [Ktedonobacterales bacterium]